jgi:hypothetical protein
MKNIYISLPYIQLAFRSSRQKMGKQFLSQVEFARVLGINLSALFRLRKANVSPYNAALRIGRQLRYPSSIMSELLGKHVSRAAELSEAFHD